jgi:hypothetical protein
MNIYMRAAAAAPRTVTATRGVCNLELPLVFPEAEAEAEAEALALALALSPEILAVAIAPDAIEIEAVGTTAEALAFPEGSKITKEGQFCHMMHNHANNVSCM